MSYFNLLGLEKEPFSTSPDPSFFFLSKEHKAALCRLQIAIALRRGLCVILGDVGTGKTTLSRKFATLLKDEEDVLFHMILNPYFQTEKQFLSRLATLFHLEVSSRATALDYMEAIERHLFHCGVEENKTVVLLVDEAQILPEFVLETLRILLNYETNEYKMLQLVLVGQMELLPRISRMENFWDRIAMKYVLNPLDVDEVKEMLDFRLQQAGYQGGTSLFTNEAVRRIWEHTQGYPRKLAQFCHHSLEGLVMYDRAVVDEALVDRLIAGEVKPTDSRLSGEPGAAVAFGPGGGGRLDTQG
ncbi:MAG: AAA family ATPase [Lentisphaerae bacterium]|nr:AAA family ATPase [Lentisphaerota bacterium]